MDAAADSAFLRNLLLFGRSLRSAGLEVSLEQILGFARALDWIDIGSRRQVFDAVRIHIPGSHRLFANVEFADPNIYSRQDRTTDFTSTSYPPFTYAVTTDPVTNVRDGILKRPATDPLVFHIDTSNEALQPGAITFVAEIEHHRFLARIQPHEITALAVDRAVVATGKIALGALDLEHFGTGKYQTPRTEGRGGRLFQRHDLDPGKWPRHSFSSIAAAYFTALSGALVSSLSLLVGGIS